MSDGDRARAGRPKAPYPPHWREFASIRGFKAPSSRDFEVYYLLLLLTGYRELPPPAFGHPMR